MLLKMSSFHYYSIFLSLQRESLASFEYPKIHKKIDLHRLTEHKSYEEETLSFQPYLYGQQLGINLCSHVSENFHNSL